MSATVAVPPTLRRRSLDLDRNRAVLGTLGVGLVAVAVAVALLVFALFGGHFTRYSVVTVELPPGSSAVSDRSAVEYLGVTIGDVVGQGRRAPDGRATVVAHLRPSTLTDVPANVAATVAPVSIFGNQYVVLEPPAVPTGRLAAGATILPSGGGRSITVQDTIGDLDHLLNALQPAQLDDALTAVAEALQGQGQTLGVTLVRASTYLRQMQPLWPTAVQDLKLLIPVADQLSTSAPDLVGLLTHSTTTAGTVTSQQGDLDALLTQGSAAASAGASIFSASTGSLTTLIDGSAPILGDISANQDEVAEVLTGLTDLSHAVTAASANGPYLSATADVNVVNTANLGLAALGGPDMVANLTAGLGSAIVDPPTYTEADCPALVTLHCPGTPAGAQAVSSLLLGPFADEAAGR